MGQDLTRRALVPGFTALWATPALAQLAPALPPVTPPLPPTDVVKSGVDLLDRMTAPVMVNGRGPFAFMVDTGAERSALSVELAAELALPPGSSVTVHGVAGAAIEPTAVVEELAVGSRRLHNAPLPLLTRANLGAPGVLGLDVLQGQRVALDFRRHLIEVEATPAQRNSDEIVVSAHSRFGQLVLVDSWFQSRPVLVVIDTGAETTIGNPAFGRLVRSTTWEARSQQTDIFSVTGQVASGAWAVVPTVEVGGFALNRLAVVFSDLHSFARWQLQDQPALLLGMDVLRQFDSVHIDFARRQVRFRGPHSLAPSFARDCASTPLGCRLG